MSENEKLSFSMRQIMPAIERMLSEGQTVSLTVRGVSMQPFLMDGRDEILMTAPGGRKPRVGDMYMFRRDDGSYAMHRICAVERGGTLSFVGDGQLNPEKGISPDALAAYVPQVIRNGKRIDCDKGAVRVLMTARMKLRLMFPGLIIAASALKRRAASVFRGGRDATR